MPSAGFKADDALACAAALDLQIQAHRIRSRRTHRSIKQPWVVRKGCFVALFETHGVLDAFVAQHWPTRHTPAGERRRDLYLARMARNERLLAHDPLGTTGVVGASEDGTDTLIEAVGATFGLERDLQPRSVRTSSHLNLGCKSLMVAKSARPKPGASIFWREMPQGPRSSSS
jgi:hypothetical protein